MLELEERAAGKTVGGSSIWRALVTGMGAPAHGDGSRSGLIHNRGVEIRVKGQAGEQVQNHLPPTLFH